MAHRKSVVDLKSQSITLAIAPRCLRPPAAAIYLGTTPFYIEELMRNGELPFVLIGGARVVTIEALNKYVDSLPVQSGKLAGRGIHIAKAAA
jgi:excisionase family DNA binding protein